MSELAIWRKAPEQLHRKYLSAMRWRILVRVSSYLYRGDLL